MGFSGIKKIGKPSKKQAKIYHNVWCIASEGQQAPKLVLQKCLQKLHSTIKLIKLQRVPHRAEQHTTYTFFNVEQQVVQTKYII